MSRVLELGKHDYYEHTLVETCCDYCGKKTMTPQFFKVENEWKLWFFDSLECQQKFGRRGEIIGGLCTVQ